MIAPYIQVQVSVSEPGLQLQQSHSVSPLETLTELFGRVIFQHPLFGEQSDWLFHLNGQPLTWASTVGEVAQLAGEPAVLVFTLYHVGVPQEQAEGAGGDWDEEDAAPLVTMYPVSPAKTAPGAPPAPSVTQPAPPPQSIPTEPDSRLGQWASSDAFREERSKKRGKYKRGRATPTDLDDEFEADERELVARTAISRQATVRYYHRMNPQRVYPFLVVLSAEEIAEIVQKGVKQAAGERFDVDAESPVEIEPVLPGCQCYPPRHTLVIGPETQPLEFWVVPQVLGTIRGAKVIVRQDGRTLSEVKLEAKVVKQTAAVVVAVLSFVMPYISRGMRSDNPDGSQVQTALNWVSNNLRPEFLFVGLALVAVGLYLWCRPRQRDQFWDVTPKR